MYSSKSDLDKDRTESFARTSLPVESTSDRRRAIYVARRDVVRTSQGEDGTQPDAMTKDQIPAIHHEPPSRNSSVSESSRPSKKGKASTPARQLPRDPRGQSDIRTLVENDYPSLKGQDWTTHIWPIAYHTRKYRNNPQILDRYQVISARRQAFNRLKHCTSPTSLWRASVEFLVKVYRNWDSACRAGWFQDEYHSGWAAFHFSSEENFDRIIKEYGGIFNNRTKSLEMDAETAYTFIRDMLAKEASSETPPRIHIDPLLAFWWNGTEYGRSIDESTTGVDILGKGNLNQLAPPVIKEVHWEKVGSHLVAQPTEFITTPSGEESGGEKRATPHSSVYRQSSAHSLSSSRSSVYRQSTAPSLYSSMTTELESTSSRPNSPFSLISLPYGTSNVPFTPHSQEAYSQLRFNSKSPYLQQQQQKVKEDLVFSEDTNANPPPPPHTSESTQWWEHLRPSLPRPQVSYPTEKPQFPWSIAPVKAAEEDVLAIKSLLTTTTKQATHTDSNNWDELTEERYISKCDYKDSRGVACALSQVPSTDGFWDRIWGESLQHDQDTLLRAFSEMHTKRVIEDKISKPSFTKQTHSCPDPTCEKMPCRSASEDLSSETCRGEIARRYLLESMAQSPCALLRENISRQEAQKLIESSMEDDCPTLQSLQSLRQVHLDDFSPASLLFFAAFGRAGTDSDQMSKWLISMIQQARHIDEIDSQGPLSYFFDHTSDSDETVWRADLMRASIVLSDMLASPHFTANWELGYPKRVAESSLDRKEILRTKIMTEKYIEATLVDILPGETYRAGKLFDWKPLSFSIYSSKDVTPFAEATTTTSWDDVLQVGWRSVLVLLLGWDALPISNERTKEYTQSIPVLFPDTWGDLVWLDCIDQLFCGGRVVTLSPSTPKHEAVKAITVACAEQLRRSRSRYVYIAPLESPFTEDISVDAS